MEFQDKPYQGRQCTKDRSFYKTAQFPGITEVALQQMSPYSTVKQNHQEKGSGKDFFHHFLPHKLRNNNCVHCDVFIHIHIVKRVNQGN